MNLGFEQLSRSVVSNNCSEEKYFKIVVKNNDSAGDPKMKDFKAL